VAHGGERDEEDAVREDIRQTVARRDGQARLAGATRPGHREPARVPPPEHTSDLVQLAAAADERRRRRRQVRVAHRAERRELALAPPEKPLRLRKGPWPVLRGGRGPG